MPDVLELELLAAAAGSNIGDSCLRPAVDLAGDLRGLWSCCGELERLVLFLLPPRWKLILLLQLVKWVVMTIKFSSKLKSSWRTEGSCCHVFSGRMLHND